MAALRRLDAAGSDVPLDVIPAFVTVRASAATHLVLVLDDCNLVTSAQVHASVVMLLDRSSPQPHLLLITRADPAGHRSAPRAGGHRSCRPGQDPDQPAGPGHLFYLHVRQVRQQHPGNIKIARRT